jgi:hypothetical protein
VRIRIGFLEAEAFHAPTYQLIHIFELKPCKEIISKTAKNIIPFAQLELLTPMPRAAPTIAQDDIFALLSKRSLLIKKYIFQHTE